MVGMLCLHPSRLCHIIIFRLHSMTEGLCFDEGEFTYVVNCHQEMSSKILTAFSRCQYFLSKSSAVTMEMNIQDVNIFPA